MSYQVLARKWRPAQFADVVGQQHIIAALSNALDQDRAHHAYLFTGTRGVGKTTLARIFAKALNCEKGVSATPCGECAACRAVAEGRFVDLIEVDAASRTKVDDTRELLENVQYAPTLGRYKVYLIDEVHMLSAHSFNALLKTLEEPPDHVKFLLATTDPQKLPVTVLSRCIQFSLNAIEPHAIEQQLAKILNSESIEFEPAALSLLARSADGSLRDALSLLDQAIAYSNQQLGEDKVREMLGLVDGQVVVSILDALAQNNADELMQSSVKLVTAAQNLRSALDDLLAYLHALALYQFVPDAIEWKGLVRVDVERLAQMFSPEILQLYYQITLAGKRDFAYAPDPRTGFEMVLLRLLAFSPGEANSAPRKKLSEERVTTAKAVGARKETAVPFDRALEEPVSASGERGAGDLSPCVANLSEDLEPFLKNGLANADLQKHLKPASAIGSMQVDTPRPPRLAAEAPDEITRENATYLPKEMMQINTLVDNINVWSDFVVKTGLSGVARQLVVHMHPVSFRENVLQLELDQQYSNLRSPERLKQISDALQKGCGQTFKVNVEVASVEHAETAAGVIAERERSNLEKTRQDFKEDENVREIVSLFDAEVDETSIKSIN